MIGKPDTKFNVAVLGGGAAGIVAAISAARAERGGESDDE